MLKLSRWQLLFYAGLAFPLAMLGLPLFVYLPLYYSESFALGLGLIGTALLLSRLLDVLTDPVIGWLSDRLLPFLSRIHQIAIALMFLAGALYGLLLPDPESVSFGGLIFWSFLTYLAWTAVQVPYYALAAELSEQSHEKTRLTAMREAWVVLGVLTILLLPFLLELPIESRAFYQLLYPIWLVSVVLALALLWCLPTQSFSPRQETESHAVLPLIHQLWQREPQVFQIMPLYFLNQLANALPATLFLFFVSDYLQLEDLKGLYLILYFVSGMLALPIWLALAKRLDKARTWQLSMGLAAISFCGVFWLQPGDAIGFAVITLLTGLSLGVDMAMPASIQADMGQKAQGSVKQSIQGILFGLWGLLTKLALAIAAGTALPILEWAQTLETAHNWPEAWPYWLLYAGIPILLKFWAVSRLQRFVIKTS